MKLKKRALSAGLALSAAIGIGTLFPLHAGALAYNWNELPDWVPTDFMSAMDFRNTYGSTHAEDRIICIVQRVSDGNRLDFDIEAKAPEGMEDVDCRGSQATKLTFKFELPEEPDESDAEAYADYEDFMRAIETTDIAEKGTGYHYEAIVVYTDDDEKIDVKSVMTDGTSDNAYTYSFCNKEGSYIETDMYGWLPDCVPEFTEYVRTYGNISYHDGKLIYCNTVNYSTGASFNTDFSGIGKVKRSSSGGVRKEYLIRPVGDPSYIVDVFEGDKEGDVDISFTIGRNREADNDESEIAQIHVNSDMTVSSRNAPEAPPWLPQTEDEVIAFVNKHGKTWVKDGIICFARLINSKYANGYTYEYNGTAAEKISDYEIFHKVIPVGNSKKNNAYEVYAYDIPNGSSLDVQYIDNNYNGNVKFKFSFEKDSTGYILQKDKYAWLPDCTEEFSAYYEKHGAFSIQNGYLMYCTEMPIGADLQLFCIQEGSGRFVDDYEEEITKKTPDPVDGGTKRLIKLYKPVIKGESAMTLYKSSYANRNVIPEDADIKRIKIYSDMGLSFFNGTEVRMTMEGDCNCDGTVGLSDVIALQRWLHGKGGISANSAPDVNADGTVDIFDLIVLKKRVLATMSEAPRPVFVKIDENYAWFTYQTVTIYDQYGNGYGFLYSGDPDISYNDARKMLLRMSGDDWFDRITDIMDKAVNGYDTSSLTEGKENLRIEYSYTAGSLPDTAVKAVNSFAENTEKYSKVEMYSEGFACDMGETSIYTVDVEKKVFAEISEYGDSVGWIDDDECRTFVKILSSFDIFGSGVINYFEKGLY